MKRNQLEALKKLALAGALKGHLDITSSELAELIGTSQQTASNRILELVDLGAISREMRLRRQRIRITEKGVAELRKEYLEYRKVFESYDRLTITGELTRGSGEGSYYLQQDEYREQFERILGSMPFEGTLNLKVRGREAEKLSLLKSMEGILVKGFQSGRRTFGDVKCFLATIHNRKCAVVIPLRSHHSEMVEIISELKLRDAFNMNDGDLVTVNVDLVPKA